jgi:hypothetical protein
VDTQSLKGGVHQRYSLVTSDLFLLTYFLEGKIYDSKDPKIVIPQIQSFIATYSINTSELLEQDITKYPVSSFSVHNQVPCFMDAFLDLQFLL